MELKYRAYSLFRPVFLVLKIQSNKDPTTPGFGSANTHTAEQQKAIIINLALFFLHLAVIKHGNELEKPTDISLKLPLPVYRRKHPQVTSERPVSFPDSDEEVHYISVTVYWLSGRIL